jgi:hypothetical protein
MLLDRFYVPFDDVFRLRLQGCGVRLAYSKTLQNIRYKTGLEVTSLITMQLPRYSETAEVRSQCFRICRSFLAGNGVGRCVGRAPLRGWLSSRTGSRRCTVSFASDSWLGVRDWLQRCRIIGITSQYLFLPGVSST